LALRERRRSAGARRGDPERDRVADGRHRPLRGGWSLVGHPRRGRSVAVGLSVRHEVLTLPLRDPFRIARSDHGAGTRITTVVIELHDDRLPDIVGLGEGYPDRFYGETPETMATVMPLPLEASREANFRVRGGGAGALA